LAHYNIIINIPFNVRLCALKTHTPNETSTYGWVSDFVSFLQMLSKSGDEISRCNVFDSVSFFVNEGEVLLKDSR